MIYWLKNQKLITELNWMMAVDGITKSELKSMMTDSSRKENTDSVDGKSSSGAEEHKARDYLKLALNTCISGNMKGALECFDKGIEILEDIIKNDRRIDLQSELGRAYENKGISLCRLGDLRGSLSHLEQAVKIAEDVTNLTQTWESMADLASALMNKAEVLTSMGDYGYAMAVFDRAIGIFHKLVFKDGRGEYLSRMGRSQIVRSLCLFNLGHKVEAENEIKKTIDMLQKEVICGNRQDLQETINMAHQMINIL